MQYKMWIIIKSSILFLLLCCTQVLLQELPRRKTPDLPGSTALDNFPLIDGHNDFAASLRILLDNKLHLFDFDTNLTNDSIFGRQACWTCATDLTRLRKGKVGGVFWSAYVDCDSENQVVKTLEQIDVIKRLVQNYPDDLKFVTTADGILKAFKQKKIASLIGVEGGQAIANNLAILRIYYELGVRYLTLTHVCNLPWADSATVDQLYTTIHNLTLFGKKVIWEMNRLGMIVDLAHVSRNVMAEALSLSKAPVMFSHSSSKAIHSHARNVDDNILKKLKENKGVIMVNFYSKFIGEGKNTIDNVIAHINHIVDVIGVDHVGIGADYDGVTELPVGLEDVSKYPDLFDKLKTTNSTRWTIENLEKLAGRNVVRVIRAAENLKAKLQHQLPDDDLFEAEREKPNKT